MQPCVIWFLRRPKFRNPRSVVINTFHFRFKRVVSPKLVMERVRFHWNVSMTRCSMHIIAYILHSALNICPQQLKTYNEWNRSTYIPYTKCLIKINLRTITRVAVSCKPLFTKISKNLKRFAKSLQFTLKVRSQSEIKSLLRSGLTFHHFYEFLESFSKWVFQESRGLVSTNGWSNRFGM